MATRVIIVRHGQSSYNALGKIQGRCDDSVLTDKGRTDAKIVGNNLKTLKIDAIYCSPLKRAVATAETIHSCLSNAPNLQPSEDLREIDLPLWENMEKTVVKEKYSEEYRCWKENPQEFKMLLPEGKVHYPVASLYRQAKGFWERILPQHAGQTVLIVAHNGINRCLIMSALGINIDHYHCIIQSNCCINVLNFTGGVQDIVQLESLNQTAHLGVPIPPLRETLQGPRILLIRHGETDWNRESRFQGIKDIPLNDRGRQQAKIAATFLKDIDINFAVSSPMLRPKETAEIILQEHLSVELVTRKNLEEICHGLWEGKLESEIRQEFPGMLEEWQQRPETVQMPEGENLQDVWERAIATWQGIVEEFTGVGIVVAHDAINKVILCHLLGLDPASFWSIKQGNGGVSVIDYPQGLAGKPILQAINITTHLSGSILDQTAKGAL